LSRKLDSAPVSQKYMALLATPSVETRAMRPLKAPSMPARRMAMAGNHGDEDAGEELGHFQDGLPVELVARRMLWAVVFQLMAARTSSMMSRAMFCSSTCTW
jgi:hypothetical protein